MVSALEISVQNLLRSSEELKTVLEVQTIPEELEEDYYGEAQSPGSYEVESYAVKRMVAERRRVLAVVMHVDTSSGEEQGWCVFRVSVAAIADEEGSSLWGGDGYNGKIRHSSGLCIVRSPPAICCLAC